jgi:hypothetical protein
MGARGDSSKKIEGVYPILIKSINEFDKLLNSPAGIYVLNENSMIDTERIDLFDKGKVAGQSVNLERMTGNARVLKVLEGMLARKDCAFFPGTLLRDFGGFYIPTIPVISEEKIILERVKCCGPTYIDDKAALARSFGRYDLAKELENYRGPEFEGPAKEFNRVINEKVGKIAIDSIRSIRVGQYQILPIICNEMPIILNYYEGEKINLVVHCCDNLFTDGDERLKSYERFVESMQKKNLIKYPFMIAASQQGSGDYPNMISKTLYLEKRGAKL